MHNDLWKEERKKLLNYSKKEFSIHNHPLWNNANCIFKISINSLLRLNPSPPQLVKPFGRLEASTPLNFISWPKMSVNIRELFSLVYPCEVFFHPWEDRTRGLIQTPGLGSTAPQWMRTATDWRSWAVCAIREGQQRGTEWRVFAVPCSVSQSVHTHDLTPRY